MTDKNVYAAALDSELHHSSSLGAFCDVFGGPEPAFKWLQTKHTEKEIIEILRKLGYEIKESGSEDNKYLCKAGI